MAAGLRRQQKRGITRRFLYKTEAQCKKLFPLAIVTRHGERYIEVKYVRNINSSRFNKSFTIRLSWGNMSTGESFGTPLIDGKWPGWGEWEEQLKDAYGKL